MIVEDLRPAPVQPIMSGSTASASDESPTPRPGKMKKLPRAQQGGEAVLLDLDVELVEPHVLDEQA